MTTSTNQHATSDAQTIAAIDAVIDEYTARTEKLAATGTIEQRTKAAIEMGRQFKPRIDEILSTHPNPDRVREAIQRRKDPRAAAMVGRGDGPQRHALPKVAVDGQIFTGKEPANIQTHNGRYPPLTMQTPSPLGESPFETTKQAERREAVKERLKKNDGVDDLTRRVEENNLRRHPQQGRRGR